ncbi:MAG: phosphatase PAP2 family protein [Alphaproteobacteria bacterium]|nr:phosphatase PAP2 family protein [Alphaproteobacteria bacterium]MBU1550487.1 phosphatase PAP2 family protein [Alphaproteobacteria bacterium]MBU2338623.1 phosphatase PAP2 family protein [Alphaproteobacteria bacterium]MBU2386714.1 phosphatase PAP2 family protein [Alphaproteobacteria bacterium]|tara:strand:- start:2596 stop:3303 length:708 start_codon:yes stop_codon:yes gene_type:complete
MAYHQRVGRRIVERIMTFEPISLVLFAVAAGGLFVFFQLTGEVLEGETRAFDETVLLMLRSAEDPGTAIGPFWLSHAMNDITALGGTTVLSLMTVLVTGYLVLARRRKIAIFTLLSVVGGWVLSASLKLGVARPRPDIVPHLVEVHDLSFPSGHAMLSAVTYLTLGALLSRAEPGRITRIYTIGVAVLLTFLIGVSRVFLGVHYPTDVLGGWCAGATWALICWLIARRYIAQTPG